MTKSLSMRSIDKIKKQKIFDFSQSCLWEKYIRCELEVISAIVEYICKKKFDVHTRSVFFEIWVGFISEMAGRVEILTGPSDY